MPNPYNIFLDPDTGFYSFRTDQRLIYSAKFSRVTQLLPPLLGIYDIDIHEFMFYPYDPLPNVRKSKDERVEATLQNMVTGFFTTPERVLLYLCDASDGRADQRQKLFTRWGENVRDMFDHHPLEIAIGPAKAQVGLLTRKDFPYPDILQNELIDKAEEIVLEKFGAQRP